MAAHSNGAQYDVIVVGGGPGGSTTAALIAKRNNHRVLLLEKEKFPRYQIGESLLPFTIHGIGGMLGLRDEFAKHGFIKKTGGSFLWGKNPEPWRFDFDGSPLLRELDSNFAFHVERDKFDKLLLDNARKLGAEVREQSTVKDAIIEDGRVVGVRYTDVDGHDHEVRARFVVDASGNTGTLHRHAGTRVYSEFFQNVALFTYFRGAKRLPEPHTGNFYGAAFEGGWFWFIPLSDTLTSVGAVVSKEHVDAIQKAPEKAFNELIDRCPSIKAMLEGSERITEGLHGQFRVRKDYSYSNTKITMPGLYLVGDAGCFIDPVLSTGVHLATYAGMLAARSINTSLDDPTISEERCQEEYESRYMSEFGRLYSVLIVFYDLNRDEDSYFWSASAALNTEHEQQTGFVELLGGFGDPEAFFHGAWSVSDKVKERMNRKGKAFRMFFFAPFDENEVEEAMVGKQDLSVPGPVGVMRRAVLGQPEEVPERDGGMMTTEDFLAWREPSLEALEKARLAKPKEASRQYTELLTVEE
ncbi:MAG TPA: tryptophan 7-halogenase [Candidatus Xenobia bacterium]|jgi:halogenation protein CepH